MTLLGARLRSASSTAVITAVTAAILGVLLLVPPIGPTIAGPASTQAWHGRITAQLDPHRPDPTGQGFLPEARVLLLEGPQSGTEIEAYLQGPGGQQDSDAYRVGEDVVVSATGDPGGTTFYAVADRWRLPQIALLAAVFVLAVVLVGGWRGARALLGLALTIALILKVLIPLLLLGVPPIPVAVVVATAMTLLSIGLTEGFSRPAVAAMLGTAAALALTALLAALATAFAGFTNTQGSDLAAIRLPNGEGLDLRGLLLAAFMIGSVGVLDDVTVTQAAAVDELARNGLTGPRLYAGAFSVGRSHIAATVNTLFLAYAGVGLPSLVYLLVANQPATLLINGESIAIEIVRTLVGSLGIVAAVPLTTAVAVWLVSAERRADAADGGEGRPLGWARVAAWPAAAILVAGLAVVGVATLAATAAIDPVVATGPRVPLTPDRLGPFPSASAPAGSPGSSALSSPAGSPVAVPSDLPIFQVGDDVPIFDAAGNEAGTVQVVDVEPRAAGAGIAVAVELRYVASAPVRIDPSAWALRGSDGAPIAATTPADPGAHPAIAGTLAAGETRTGWLEFLVTSPPEPLLLDYRALGERLFAVQLL